MRHTLNYTAIALGLATSTFLANTAYALDGHDLLAKINAFTHPQGLEVAADSIDVDGDDVHLKSIKISFPDNADTVFNIGDLTLLDVQKAEDGGYDIGKVDVPGFEVNEPDVRFTSQGMTFEKCRISANPRALQLSDLSYCELMAAGGVRLFDGDIERLSIQGARFSNTPNSVGTGIDFGAKIDGLLLNFLNTSKESSAADTTWKAVGVDEARGSFSAKGTWTLADGRMTFAENVLTVDDIGSLSVSGEISGYTLQAMYELQDATKDAETQHADNPQLQYQALTAAMMELAQKLSLHNASIRFEDDGVTARALAYFATQQNSTPEQFIAGLNLIAARKFAELAPLLGEELASQLTSSIKDYLDDPRSLTVAATPSQGVPFGTVISTAMAAPETLSKALAVQVTAND
ncbi:hypothetical protein [Agrobacterium fabrum]|uniref:hypothetical protein n=1 Tax=Agrobacterium fabrum TaxID=1176649 RepID=UPI003BA1A587